MPLPERLKGVYDAILAATRQGLGHLTAEDAVMDGRFVTLSGRRHINFGSCSYVGLETDARLVEAARDAVARFGVQFASSRAYVSCTLYEELEHLLHRIFRSPIVVAQTTSLAHFSALPVLIGEGDAVLFDQFVHHSVQAVIPTLRESRVHCEPVRHNDVAELSRRIEELHAKFGAVWYLADGIYSMSGELAPVRALRELLDRYERMHLYVDDAHGMSWTGQFGRGWVLSDQTIHPRMVVALSLAKAFAASGAALVFPTAEWAHLIRTCGSTMIFSGPLQPALLGAAIASARIHLSDEIAVRQRALADRIELFNASCATRGVSLASSSRSPIRFVRVGPEERAYELASSLMHAGYFANVATYPAVPRRQAGIRVALTVHQHLDDIRDLVGRLSPIDPS